MPFCVKCGTDGDGEFCATCGHPRGVDSTYVSKRQAYETEVHRVATMTAQRHGIPALIAFFIPGLGQMIKGQFALGFGVMVLMFVFLMLCYVVVGFPLLFILWVVQLYDAYVKPDAETSARIKALEQSGPPG